MAQWKSLNSGYSLMDSSYDLEDQDHTFNLNPPAKKVPTNSEGPILSAAHLANGNGNAGPHCVSCRTIAQIEECSHLHDPNSTMFLPDVNQDDSSDDIPLLFAQSSQSDMLSTSLESGSSDHCHESLPHRTHAKAAQKRLSIACVLCLVFIAGEIVGGYLSNSLAIMTDAAHLFSDFASFCISLFAIWLSGKPSKKAYNYGYFRAEALGALFTVILIWYVTGILLYLAIRRLINNDFEVESNPMMIVAGCAVLFNILLGVLLHGAGHVHSHGGSGSKHSHSDSHGHSQHHLNIRAALIHVLGDLIQSIGVLISSIIIKIYPDFKEADPICTIMFSVIVFCTTITVFRDTVRILLEGFPRSLNYETIRNDLCNVPDVIKIHDLRVWCLTTDRMALSVHLAVNSSTVLHENVIQQATRMLRKKHGIHLTTIQVEDYKSQIMAICEQCQEPMK